jgi:hypothetical protein
VRHHARVLAGLVSFDSDLCFEGWR